MLNLKGVLMFWVQFSWHAVTLNNTDGTERRVVARINYVTHSGYFKVRNVCMPVTQPDVISTTLNYVKIIHYSQTLCPNHEEEAAAGDFVLVLCLEILCIIECI